ncbi:MAG: hypothetical protein HYZ39_26480 [Mycolicibacterium cosmeticum]|nr:hypothetical protein [Mycolicibacterium cosmeticum]
MFVAPRWLLRVPALDELGTGVVRLTVPLVDDMIQIGLGGRYRTGAIDVIRRPALLTVRRTDGRPLQAQIVRDEPITVLRAPIPHLTLRRVHRGLWMAPSGVPVATVADLEQLVRTVANFGVAKQQRAGMVSAAV